MRDVDRLRRIVDELRRMREACEPKSNQNPRYHAYSAAVSALNKVIQDLETEDPSPAPSVDLEGADDRLAELHRRFGAWVDAGIPELQRAGYDPTRFQVMVRQHGAVGATKILLGSRDHTSSGIQRLYELGRLDASVEFGALLPWFEDLFTEAERYEARSRLILHNFDVDGQIARAVANRPAWTWQV